MSLSLCEPLPTPVIMDFLVPAGGSGEADLQIRFVPGYALDPDAIKSYIKIGQLQETKKKWPAGRLSQLLYARAHEASSDCV